MHCLIKSDLRPIEDRLIRGMSSAKADSYFEHSTRPVFLQQTSSSLKKSSINTRYKNEDNTPPCRTP